VELGLRIEVPKLLGAVINFVVVTPIAFVVFPKYLGLPYGQIESNVFRSRLGLTFSDFSWKYILLGLSLAVCTLGGMLVASILTGRYQFNPSTINITHLVFSLNPAFWEEIFYRGVLMILLLKLVKSIKTAAVVQIILFGLAHIKGFGLWDFLDVISVMVLAVGFTYTAFKTRSLVPGIIFHYAHDAFLFTVQPPGKNFNGVTENLVFFGLLWTMVGIGCLITRFSIERLNFRKRNPLYDYKGVLSDSGLPNSKRLTHSEKQPD
jgi:membrane protease YdiL (CAAX protease family)